MDEANSLKILARLEELHDKMDDIINRIEQLEGKVRCADTKSMEVTRSPSDVVMEQQMEDRVDLEGRVKCPKCGSLNVGQKEDRTNPINYMGGVAIYAKKFYCKQCANEWK